MALYKEILLLFLCFAISVSACAETKYVSLTAEIGGTSITGPAGSIVVTAGSVLPLIVHKTDSGNTTDVTSDPRLIIQIIDEDRAYYMDGYLHIKQFQPGELLTSNDFGVASLDMVYHDDSTGEHGVNFITLEIHP